MPDTVIPYGIHQGSPCIKVDYAEIDPFDQGSLAEYLKNRRRSHRFYEFAGEVPWGALHLDKSLLAQRSNQFVAHLDGWAMRSCFEERWAMTGIWNCVNASECFSADGIKNLVQTLKRIPHIPIPDEVVVVDPPEMSMQVGFLDEAGQRFYAPGFIYTSDPDVYDRAVEAIAKCHSIWSVRWK